MGYEGVVRPPAMSGNVAVCGQEFVHPPRSKQIRLSRFCWRLGRDLARGSRRESSMKGQRESDLSRRKPARATLSDVAREAGVSIMTVSNFVHAKPVRAATGERGR